MGTAFSSSLFGLGGSLVLGFLDLQSNQAQNRFFNTIEEKLSVSLKSCFVLSSGLLKFIGDLLEFLKIVPGEYFAKLSKKYPKIYFLTTLSLTEFAILFNFFSSDASADGDEEFAFL